jgi:hypothetical protein
MLPKPFLSGIALTVEKISPHFWATSAIFNKLPKANNHPLGENSPNLVTLTGSNHFAPQRKNLTPEKFE